MTEINLTNKKHKNKEIILINFKFDFKLKELIKSKFNANWSKTLKAWYIPYDLEKLNILISNLKENYTIINNVNKAKHNFNQAQKDFLNGFFKFLRGKRYSKSTIDTYIFFIADFINYFNQKKYSELTNRDVEIFIENVFIKRNYSVSTQRQFISAIKQLILYDTNSQISDLKLTRPKKSKKLPIVLSKEEVIDILRSTPNLKHQAIIALLYSSGIRIGELLGLKIIHLNVDRRQIFIKEAKGRKDRYVILAKSIMPLLFKYFSAYKPEKYVFEGQKGKKYSASSVRKFLKKYTLKANIKKEISPHTLRHSFATHLLEDGISLRHIQELLGHSKPETTMIYTKVTQKDILEIKSPLDNIIFNLKNENKLEQKLLLSRNYKG